MTPNNSSDRPKQKEILSEAEIEQVLGEAYTRLVAAGFSGGMGGDTWDKAAARAIETAALSKLRAPVADELVASLHRMASVAPASECEVLHAAANALASAPVADERAAQEYGSPADVAQRIEQYLAQDGRMNSGTQLLYEAMKTLRGLAGESK